MSQTTIVLLALGYAGVLAVVMSVLAAAKRADRRAHEEYEARVRSMTRSCDAPERAVQDHRRTHALLRRTG